MMSPMSADPIITAKNIFKSYSGRPVISGMDFDVSAGRCFGFLGPNGAGKTTTLRMILGLSPPDRGELSVFGMSVPDQGARIRARIGVVPQNDNLDPDFTVIENLRIYGTYFRLDKADVNRRIDELLNFMDLADRADDRPSALSGGLKRRLTIARALINNPDLIILDEPTTGLDPQVRHAIWARLRDLRKAGKTLLLTTHYMEEAERLCDELVIMDHGKILDRGAPGQVTGRHVDTDVIEIRDIAAATADQLSTLASVHRVEQHGDTTFTYTAEPASVIRFLQHNGALHYVHRKANLEDVFLKLTGRDLRE